MKMIKYFGGLILALVILAGAANAAVITVSCSPGNTPANPILNGSGQNLASGYVQVIDSTSSSPSTPNASNGLPSNGSAVVASGPLSAAGTYTKAGISIISGNGGSIPFHYIYIVAWDTWNGSGTPTGNYGISAIAMVIGASQVYKPVSFNVNTPIAPISLSSATPNSGLQGATLPTVAIVGVNTHFTGASTVSFGSNITVGSVTFTDATHVTANNVVIAAGAATGLRSVSVTTGGETATGNIFTVTALPVATVTGILPNSGLQGQTLDVVITGSNTSWSGSMTSSVAFSGAGITVNSATATDTTHITANLTIAGAAAVGARTVTVTGASGSASFSVVAAGSPILSSATPNSGAQGATIPSIAIVGTNTHFVQGTSTISFGGTDITTGTITVTDATHISVSNVVIGAAAATGARNVTVTTAAETAQGQVFTVTGGTTQPATSLVLDDIEGTLVLPSGYYAFAPTGQTNPVQTRVTTDKHEGAYAMNTTYGALADPNNAWRGWGGSFVATKDVSAYDTLSIWVKGDGSATNKLKVQFKDANGNNYGLQDADAISQLSTGWAEYRVGGFKTKMAIVPGTTAHGTMDWTKITEYQIVFSGTGASTGVMVDYLNVTNSTSTGPHITGITPSVGGEKVTVTLTGTSFQASGGTINFAGGGTTTSIKSSDTGSLITSWADGQIVLSLPSMSRGVKTVNIVRADATPSDNSVTFEVTGTTTGGGTSYNYPNPFNPLGGEKTNIVFTPGNAANVSVYVYDMTAKQIARIDWAQGAPSAQVIWDGRNIYDEIVGDGVYLYRVVDAGSNKMIGKGKILVINK